MSCCPRPLCARNDVPCAVFVKSEAFVLLCSDLRLRARHAEDPAVSLQAGAQGLPSPLVCCMPDLIRKAASPNARQTSHRRPLCLSCRFYPAIAGHRNPFTCQLRRAIWHWIGPSRSRNLRPQCEAQSGAPPRTAPPTAAAPCSPFSSSQSSQMTQSSSA